MVELLRPIGKVVNTYGIRGHLKVIPYGETLESLETGEAVTARLPDGPEIALTALEVRPHKNILLFLSRELTAAEEARTLVGAELCVPGSRLPATEPDEFYWFQLMGLEVIDSGGRRLGTIQQIIETGSNDVYVVRENDQEVLVPAIQDVVQHVDLEQGKMIVELPETI